MCMFSNLTPKETRLFRKLSTPQKIQDYLDTLPINFEKKGEHCVLREAVDTKWF